MKGNKMVRIKEQVEIGSSPGRLALLMRRPDAIERFPGVTSAQVCQPGLRLDVALNAAGLPLKDRVVLAWRRPQHIAGTVEYPFGIEGGTWVHGQGLASLESKTHDVTGVALAWEIELPWYLRVVPGVRTAIKRRLRAATRRWLETISDYYPMRAESLTAADVGA